MEIKEISDIDYLLPPITERDENENDSGLQADYMALYFEYQRCVKREEYEKGAEVATELLELVKSGNIPFMSATDLSEFRIQRAHCNVMLKNYDAALEDINWVEKHSTIQSAFKAELLEGFIEILQGKESSKLKEQAARGDRLALLLLNEPENHEPPKTEWLLLPVEERIKRLVAGRHYSLALEEMEKIDSTCDSWPYWNRNNDLIAMKGACYALRGNYLQAITEYNRLGHYYGSYNGELAIVYGMAGLEERADHALEKSLFMEPIQQGLIQNWLEIKFA